MSHYKPYPAYRESEVEWLGRVPEHWRFELLTNVSRFQSGKAHEPFIDDDGDFICVNSRFVSTGGLSQKFCTQNLSPACIDDILMVMSDLPNGRALAKAFYSDRDGIYAVNQRVCIISPVSCSPRFLFYLLDRNCNFLSHDDGINQTHLPNSAFTKFKFYLPPSSEQQAIALVLDRETARIDALIEKKTRFIELLREKRQALITHAVTKGLDPNVKMKDSGVEWLGEVPEHWSFGRLAYACELIVDGTHHSPESHPEGAFKYITAKNIKEHGFDLTELTYISADQHREIYSRCSVKTGDVLYIKDGATAGVAMVNCLDEEFSLLSSVAVIRPKKKRLLSVYLAYLLNSGGFKTSVLSQLVGGAITRFTLEMIGNFSVSLPPIEEQRQVVAHLEGIVPRLDVLKGKTERSIALLKERRAALITAAVTGQIDLQEAV